MPLIQEAVVEPDRILTVLAVAIRVRLGIVTVYPYLVPEAAQRISYSDNVGELTR